MASQNKRKRNSLESGEQRGNEHNTGPPECLDDQKNLEGRPNKKEKVHILNNAPLPSLSDCLQIALGGSHWHAQRSFKNIVIFGDSYSKSNGDITWVDHLQRRMKNEPPKVYNFAVPAATAEDDLMGQISRFSNGFSSKGNIQTPDETTYIIFMGINDCGTTECDELESIVDDIFDAALHHLYVRAGARNFIIIDVPPVHRSPQAVESECAELIEARVKAWNESLRTQTVEFGQSYNGATVLFFSAYQALTNVLNDPLEYDFSEDDPAYACGSIWMDDLHLTPEVHDILAKQLLMAVLEM